MEQYVVWECIKHEGWEPYNFETLKEADTFMNRKDKDEGLIDTILTKQINVMVEDEIQ